MSMSNPKEALDWFYIEYAAGDTIGWLLASFSLTPFVIVVALLTLCVFRRDVHVMYIFTGQVINEWMNSIFKLIFKRQRPKGSQRKDYGMPSAHAQFMGYIMTYLILLLIYHVRFSETKKTTSRNNDHNNAEIRQSLASATLPLSEKFIKGVSISFVIGTSMAVILSRIYLNYHNLEQVLVGVLLGSQIGLTWFLLYQFLLNRGWIDQFCRWRLARMFLIKNLAHIPNPLRHEYYMYQRGTQKED